MDRTPAPRNRSLQLAAHEEDVFGDRLKVLHDPVALPEILNRTICQAMEQAIPLLPSGCVDLLILDPPYNLSKWFNGKAFLKKTVDEYSGWMRTWLKPLIRLLKDTASVYVCGDWLTSASIYEVLAGEFHVRNRITWEREKGRGAKANWKNCSEDIWFATVGDDYYFDPDTVRLKRRVIAPYRADGLPKDWVETSNGNFRLTSPSNLWTDITVPFWSMPENTEHPTQKPEKLLAKLILASSRPGDLVLDPFLGSGTTSVVAKKLGRSFVGIEVDRRYCCIAEKRLAAVSKDASIQGYSGGCFWERNTLQEQLRTRASESVAESSGISLFPVGLTARLTEACPGTP